MSEAKTMSPAGKFVWYEWMGDDVKAAADFYAHVVGWTAKQTAGTGERPYTVLSAGVYGVAGMITISAEAKAKGAPPCWAGYIWVEDVDKAAAKLIAAGGAVKRPPSRHSRRRPLRRRHRPAGRVLQAVPRRRRQSAAPARARHARPHRLARVARRRRRRRRFAFYSGLFGWTKRSAMDMGAMGVYQLFGFAGGERDYGGIMTRTPQTPGPFWLYYFNVPAIDAAVERVKAKGGKIVNGPMEVPGGQWIVQATRPGRRAVRAGRAQALRRRTGPRRARAAGRERRQSRGVAAMRVMVIVKATTDSEAGKMPSAELIGGDGRVQPQADRRRRDGRRRRPEADRRGRARRLRRRQAHGASSGRSESSANSTRAIGSGRWSDLDEAIGWVKQCPNPMPGPSEIEIRPLYEMEDFA